MHQHLIWYISFSCKLSISRVIAISWLTVSIKIVKSLSLSRKKFYFFNMVQPIDLTFCKMVEIIEQNIFNRADFLFWS